MFTNSINCSLATLLLYLFKISLSAALSLIIKASETSNLSSSDRPNYKIKLLQMSKWLISRVMLPIFINLSEFNNIV